MGFARLFARLVLGLAAAAGFADGRRHSHGATNASLCPACFGVSDAPRNRSLSAMRWLHIPKSGSTFQNTVFHWACPGLPPRAGYGPRAMPYKLKALYVKGGRLDRDVCDRDLDKTIPGHAPAVADALERTVAMFRRPGQRIISAFNDGKHCDGFQDEDKDPGWKRLDVAAYARHRGIPGCATRMLLGGKCSRSRRVRVVYEAASAVAALKKLAFVGLVERWRDSVCLFHAMHGGAPLPIEFAVAHSTRGRDVGDAPPPYDETVLAGAVDADEEAVYAAARATFDARMARHAPACDLGHFFLGGS